MRGDESADGSNECCAARETPSSVCRACTRCTMVCQSSNACGSCASAIVCFSSSSCVRRSCRVRQTDFQSDGTVPGRGGGGEAVTGSDCRADTAGAATGGDEHAADSDDCCRAARCCREADAVGGDERGAGGGGGGSSRPKPGIGVCLLAGFHGGASGCSTGRVRSLPCVFPRASRSIRLGARVALFALAPAARWGRVRGASVDAGMVSPWWIRCWTRNHCERLCLVVYACVYGRAYGE
jgi:hypothetical protein